MSGQRGVVALVEQPVQNARVAARSGGDAATDRPGPRCCRPTRSRGAIGGVCATIDGSSSPGSAQFDGAVRADARCSATMMTSNVDHLGLRSDK